MASIGTNHALNNALTEDAAPCDVVEALEGELSVAPTPVGDGKVIPPPPVKVSAGGEVWVVVFDRVTVTVATLAEQDAEPGTTMPSNQFPLSPGVKEIPPV
jgi:hypothetical protein